VAAPRVSWHSPVTIRDALAWIFLAPKAENLRLLSESQAEFSKCSTMLDITAKMNAYRELCRITWNNFFLPDAPGLAEVDAFDDLRGCIFTALVTRHCPGVEKSTLGTNALQLRVIPDADLIPIMVNRPSVDGNLYWDESAASSVPKSATLLYLDVFDWDLQGHREFHYYLVRVIQWADHPELAGRDALVECYQTRVYWSVDVA
jgi:hypothetical protein